MNIEKECGVITEHADRLMRMAQVLREQNAEYMHRITELTLRAERDEEMIAKLIEAGKNALERDGGGYERGGWHDLVAKWKAQQDA